MVGDNTEPCLTPHSTENSPLPSLCSCPPHTNPSGSPMSCHQLQLHASETKQWKLYESKAFCKSYRHMNTSFPLFTYLAMTSCVAKMASAHDTFL